MNFEEPSAHEQLATSVICLKNTVGFDGDMPLQADILGRIRSMMTNEGIDKSHLHGALKDFMDKYDHQLEPAFHSDNAETVPMVTTVATQEPLEKAA